MAVSDVDIFGRKIFFIAPDSAVAGQNRLEELCARGYEAYAVTGDGDVRAKIEAIIRLYPNSIIYVNASSRAGGTNWRALVREMASVHRGNALFGVVHNGNEDASRDWSDCDLAAGCVAMGGGDGFTALLDALKKAGAKGRRAYVRVDCDANSTVSMKIDGKTVNAHVDDMNLSHFRCTLPDGVTLKIFDKVRDAHVTANGFTFDTNAVLIMKRTKMGVHSHILMFIHGEDDKPDLDEKTMTQLNKMIYRTVSQLRMESLREELHKAK